MRASPRMYSLFKGWLVSEAAVHKQNLFFSVRLLETKSKSVKSALRGNKSFVTSTVA